MTIVRFAQCHRRVTSQRAEAFLACIRALGLSFSLYSPLPVCMRCSVDYSVVVRRDASQPRVIHSPRNRSLRVRGSSGWLAGLASRLRPGFSEARSLKSIGIIVPPPRRWSSFIARASPESFAPFVHEDASRLAVIVVRNIESRGAWESRGENAGWEHVGTIKNCSFRSVCERVLLEGEWNTFDILLGRNIGSFEMHVQWERVKILQGSREIFDWTKHASRLIFWYIEEIAVWASVPFLRFNLSLGDKLTQRWKIIINEKVNSQNWRTTYFYSIPYKIRFHV